MAASSRATPYFPYPFPTNPKTLLRIALKQATEANYHLSYLPKMLPWLFAYSALPGGPNTCSNSPTACGRSSRRRWTEHEALMERRRRGKISSQERLAESLPQSGVARRKRSPISKRSRKTSLEFRQVDRGRRARARTRPRAGFRHMACSGRPPPASPIRSRSRGAYAARFSALGGVVLKGDARSLHRSNEALACRHRRGASRRAAKR